jgi:hypothetical protein
MNRLQIKQHNQAIIALVKAWHKSRKTRGWDYRRLTIKRPRLGYKELAAKLNAGNMQTSRGNTWTFRSLYRMMQRQGVRLIDL